MMLMIVRSMKSRKAKERMTMLMEMRMGMRMGMEKDAMTTTAKKVGCNFNCIYILYIYYFNFCQKGI